MELRQIEKLDFNTAQIHAYEIKPLQLIVQPVKSTKLLKIIPATMYMQHILQNGFSFREIGGIQFVDTTTKYFQI